MRRLWIATALLALAVIIDLTWSVHARATWHPSANGPRSATLAQVAGFFTSAVLLILLAVIATEAVRVTRRARTERKRSRGRSRP
jgi:hypothetical protein